jgi:ATP-binding cassette subfamily B protein
VLLKVLGGCLPAIYIRIYTVFIDQVVACLGTGLFDPSLLWLIPAFLAFGLLRYFSPSVQSWLYARMQASLEVKLRKAQIEKISRLSYAHIENKDSYELLCRIRKGTPDEFVNGFFSWLSLIALILRIASIAWTVFLIQSGIAVVFLLLFIPMILVSLRTGKWDYEGLKRYREIQRRIGNYEKVLTDKEYVSERMIFRYQPWLIERWQEGYKDSTGVLRKVQKRSYVGIKMASGVITLSCLLMMLTMLLGMQAGTVTIGVFSAVSAELLTLASEMSWSLSSALQGISHCREFMRDVGKYEELSEAESGTEEKKTLKEIRFEDVSFRYPGTEPYVLRHLNLTLTTDKTCAIVGRNGAGKTTLTKLLLGMYPDYEGKILLDGVELRQLKTVSGLFSVAFQDFAKYQITIRDNVTLGASNGMTDDEILKVLDRLQMPITEERFPQGLDTSMGYLTETNTNLSLGQWQKLILARAVAHEGCYFLLDEPTASLDPSAENEVYESFLKILEEKASLIITHRLGAARLADCIAVIEDGRVTEYGSHEELMAKKGLYAQMFETQRGWYQ